MAGRIRSIKPEWLDDELLATSGSDARTLSIALMLLCDDYGNGRSYQLAQRAFPVIGDSSESLANASRMCREALVKLIDIRFVGLYEIDGQHYFTIRNWSKHQKVDHPGKPLVPSPPADVWAKVTASSRDSREYSRDSRESLAPDQDMDQERIRPGEGEDRSLALNSSFIHPAQRMDDTFNTTCPDSIAFTEVHRTFASKCGSTVNEMWAEFRAKRIAKGVKAANPIGWQADFDGWLRTFARNETKRVSERGTHPRVNETPGRGRTDSRDTERYDPIIAKAAVEGVNKRLSAQELQAITDAEVKRIQEQRKGRGK
jgi:hypothetical protein